MPSTPSSRPSPCSRASDAAAPRAIAVDRRAAIAGARRAAACSAPAARATSSRRMSGSPSAARRARRRRPARRRRRCSRTRSRRKAYSSPFVSSVPTRTTVAIRPVCSGSTPRKRRCASGSPFSSAAVVSVKIRPATITSWRLATLVATARFCSIRMIASPASSSQRKTLDEVLDDRGREPLGGLVHDQQQRVREQRAADREHLLLAARELRAAVLLALGEPREQAVDRVDRPVAAVARLVARGADHAQVLVDAERREQPAALRHVADARGGDRVRGLAAQLLAAERDRAARLRAA